MTKKDINKLKKLYKDIENSKKIIAKERDNLRDTYSALEDFVDNLDASIEDIEDGMRGIQSGIDALSEQM